MKKRVLIFFTIVVLIIVFTCANANTFNSIKQSVSSDIAEAREKIEELKNEKDNVLVEINEINEQISQTEASISSLETKIVELNETISFKEKDIAEKQSILDKRLSAAYMNGKDTYMEAFFNGGIKNFVSNYQILKQIAEYDGNLINDVKREKYELQSTKIVLKNSESELKTKQENLEQQRAEKQAKIDALDEEKKQMQMVIEEKYAELARINAAVLNASQGTAIQGGNGLIEGESASASAGGMTWPTRIEHTINSVYAPGGRSDTRGYTGTSHKGVDICAPAGTPIYAAKDGMVVYVNNSGYGGGWGLYVVIYHGNDENGNPIYTRYAHGSAIASGIQVGTQVNTSTVIMYSGNTGASEGAHLHFEVCIGGMYNQVNPCTFLGVPNARGTY